MGAGETKSASEAAGGHGPDEDKLVVDKAATVQAMLEGRTRYPCRVRHLVFLNDSDLHLNDIWRLALRVQALSVEFGTHSEIQNGCRLPPASTVTSLRVRTPSNFDLTPLITGFPNCRNWHGYGPDMSFLAQARTLNLQSFGMCHRSQLLAFFTLLNFNLATLQEVDLSFGFSQFHGDHDPSSIFGALMDAPSLARFIICSNNLTETHASDVGKLIASHKNLTDIELTAPDQPLASILTVISRTRRSPLYSLDLRCNEHNSKRSHDALERLINSQARPAYLYAEDISAVCHHHHPPHAPEIFQTNYRLFHCVCCCCCREAEPELLLRGKNLTRSFWPR